LNSEVVDGQGMHSALLHSSLEPSPQASQRFRTKTISILVTS
jgi:hypothetical protein